MGQIGTKTRRIKRPIPVPFKIPVPEPETPSPEPEPQAEPDVCPIEEPIEAPAWPTTVPVKTGDFR